MAPLLGVLEVLYEGAVAEDVVAGRGQPHQQVVLQTLQEDLVLVLGYNSIDIFMSQNLFQKVSLGMFGVL